MEEKLIGVVIVLEGKAHTRSLFVTCLGDCLLSDRLFEDMENLYRLWCSMGKGYFVSGSSDVLRMIKTNENLINCVVHRVR